MQNEYLVKGNTEGEIWEQIEQHFLKNPDPLDYTAVIQHGQHQVVLTIDIDLGGGFESGYETTSFIAALPSLTNFRFAIHEQHFTDEIGKFFGMQDVVIGYEEFDRKLIIKTNDETKVKSLFADGSVRAVFEVLENFTLGIRSRHVTGDDESPVVLEFLIETGITDCKKLRTIYNAFFSVLTALDPVPQPLNGSGGRSSCWHLFAAAIKGSDLALIAHPAPGIRFGYREINCHPSNVNKLPRTLSEN